MNLASGGWLQTIPFRKSSAALWERWQWVWHVFFYLLLAGSTLIVLFNITYTFWQYLALAILLTLFALWYACAMLVSERYWAGHGLLTAGYLVLGWSLWWGLLLLCPLYLFLLTSLYPQAFQLPRQSWRFLASALLTALCLLRIYIEAGTFDLFFLFCLVLGGASLAIGLFITAIIEQSQQRYRLIRELERTRQDLARSERLAGISEERQRLASDIHDTLAQGFVSILMHLETARVSVGEAQSQQLFSRLEAIARDNLTQSRYFLWALQPEAFASHTLVEVVHERVQLWSSENATPCNFTVTGEPCPLRPELEVLFLRATLEALSNVRKHAQATQVVITLSYMEDMVALDVQDDGVGFLPDAVMPCLEGVSGHFGLHTLRGRVQHYGGTLSLESSPGEGSTLALLMPLHDQTLLHTCSESETSSPDGVLNTQG